MTNQTCLRLKPELYERLRKYCFDNRISMNKVLVASLVEFLENKNTKDN